MSITDHQGHHDQIDGFDHLSAEQRAAARRTVAHYAENSGECVQFFDMLGLLPSQERDDPPEVNRPKLPSTPGRRMAKSRSMKRA